jgi:ribose 5-phosphate isomerase B
MSGNSIDRERIRAVVRDVLGDLDLPAAPATRQSTPAAPGRWSLPHIFVSPAPTRPAASECSGDPAARRRVAIGADHGGFALKRELISLLRELGYEPEDCGTYSTASCDYPDFAIAVGRMVRSGFCGLGIMIDGAGIGSAMALNKMAGIRAATVHSEATAGNSREHNDANVLVLGSMQMHAGYARRITRIWLDTDHAGGRHARRVDMINALDQGRA